MWYCTWIRNEYNDINIFLSLENPCTFLLRKEKNWKPIFNTNNFLKIYTEKQFALSKTSLNWLFRGIGCYLAIGCFDSKIQSDSIKFNLTCLCKGLLHLYVI